MTLMYSLLMVTVKISSISLEPTVTRFVQENFTDQVSSLLSLEAEPPIPAMVSDASFPAKSEEASSSSEAVAA